MRFLHLSTLSFLFACGEEIPSSFKEGDSDYDGVTEEEGDCDDSTAAISPNMFDFVGDGIDNNCDGIDGEDSDGDGFASEASRSFRGKAITIRVFTIDTITVVINPITNKVEHIGTNCCCRVITVSLFFSNSIIIGITFFER